MTDVPTTELTIYDCASDPSPVSTSGTPLTVAVGPRLYQVTTGGTAGTEQVVLPTPSLPLDGFMNDTLVGLRITFSLAAQTDPADVVRIAPDAGLLNMVAPLSLRCPAVQAVLLNYVGATVSFIWVGDQWMIDSGITDGNYTPVYPDNATVTVGDSQAHDSTGAGLSSVVGAGDGAASGNGGDVYLNPGAHGPDGGRDGLVFAPVLPTADPHVLHALWNNSGVLTVSAG